MANLYRIALALVCLLVSLSVQAAESDLPAKIWWDPGFSKPVEPSADAACSVYIAHLNSNSPNADRSLTGAAVLETETRAVCPYKSCVVGRPDRCDSASAKVYGVLRCPAGYTLTGNVCKPPPVDLPTCPPGMERAPDGQCLVPHRQQCYVFAGLETLPGGVLVQDYALSGNVAHGATHCMPLVGDSGAGCRVEFDRSMLATNPDGSSTSYGTYSINIKPGSGVVNGVPDYTCTAGDGTTTGSSKPTEAPCKNGSPGTVNGVTVCVPRQADNGVTVDDKGKTETKTESDGTKTTVKTSSSTTCLANQCTTTTTTTTSNSGGGAPTTTTSTTAQSKTDYCKANATSAQCNGTGSGSGGGDGDGDGVGPVGSVGNGKEHGQPAPYETKYPGGLKGVWDDSGIAGAEGKFGGLVSALSPSFVDTNGACLSFRVPLNLGIVSFGTVDVSPPCLIWPFIRICVLITALWLCRALIFGG